MELNDNLFARLNGLEGYFRRVLESGDLRFKSEYEAMVKINELLQNGDLHLLGLARQFDVKIVDSSAFGKGDIVLI